VLQEIQEEGKEAMQVLPQTIMKLVTSVSQAEIVFETDRSSVMLCDRTDVFTLRYFSEEISLRFSELIRFKK
jgi:hypothetical protein